MSAVHERFHDLHQSGTFLLVNVHDAGAAAVAEAAGAVALGTTSAGHAYSIGRRDGAAAITRAEAIERAAQICSVVDIPVSIDAENGWGHEPEDVAATVRDLAAVGAAGASIEDWSGDATLGFYDRSHALARITAAVEAARALPHPFVICARAEAFLYGAASPMEEATARLQSFAAAGADCLYAPGPQTKQDLATLVAEAGGPINGLIGIGSELTMADATELGIRRVSVGGSLYRTTMTMFRDLVDRIVTTGDLAAPTSPLTDADFDALLSPS